MHLTRLGPSKTVPGATGVFVSRALKKFTPIEVAPAAGATSPPYLYNLLSAPRHTVSFRRFLALRHQFSSGAYFNIATPRGWYLLVPSTHAPFPDHSGLKSWSQRHHYRYTNKDPEVKIPCPSALQCGGEGGNRFTDRGGGDSCLFGYEGNEAVEKEWGDEGERPVATFPKCATIRRGVLSPTIQEEHLFEINDGVYWETPPSDDVACSTYWKGHKERMEVYEGIDMGVEQVESTWTLGTSGHSHDLGASVEDLQHTQRLKLIRASTFKANVRLIVDEDRKLLVLVPLVDLKEDDELLLHYGREWWSQRLLSTVFMSVRDEDISNICWIESLFTKPTDVYKPFPMLYPAFARDRGGESSEGLEGIGREKESGGERELFEGKRKAIRALLYNATTGRRATNSEVLAFAVRRSCVDKDFFSYLVGAGDRHVFNTSRCDDEVPISHIRCVLLQSLLRAGSAPCDHSEKDPPGGQEVVDGDFVI